MIMYRTTSKLNPFLISLNRLAGHLDKYPNNLCYTPPPIITRAPFLISLHVLICFCNPIIAYECMINGCLFCFAGPRTLFTGGHGGSPRIFQLYPGWQRCRVELEETDLQNYSTLR